MRKVSRSLYCLVFSAGLVGAIGRAVSPVGGAAQDNKSVNNSQTATLSQAKYLLRGAVFDPTGGIVPNFKVEIRRLIPASSQVPNVTANPLLSTLTNQEGAFSFELLPGTYQICVARYPNSCRSLAINAEETPRTQEYLRLVIHPWEDI